MQAKLIRQPQIHVAIGDDDPLRVIGFRALLESEGDLEVEPVSSVEVRAGRRVDVVLLRDRGGHSLAGEVERVKTALPGARVLATGTCLDEDAILQSIAAGARGHISETASSAEFAKAIRIVSQGLFWAPRRVLVALIDRAGDSLVGGGAMRRASLTSREKEVLEMLVAGKSNKEIALPLEIEERTVKAHVAHLMRKLEVKNRIALSVHAVTHSLCRF